MLQLSEAAVYLNTTLKIIFKGKMGKKQKDQNSYFVVTTKNCKGEDPNLS